jgi:hypothetical protein
MVQYHVQLLVRSSKFSARLLNLVPMHTEAIVEVHEAWLTKNWSVSPKAPRSTCTAFSGTAL